MSATQMPTSLIAGDSLSLSISAADYPSSDGWAVDLTLTPTKGGTPLVLDGVDASGGWEFMLTATQSATLSAEDHRYLIAASKPEERATIEHGTLKVEPNPAQSNTDLRSAAQRGLDAIDAVLENRASSQDLKYVFEDGRQIDRIPHADLLELRHHFARQVAREKNNGRGPRRVLVRL